MPRIGDKDKRIVWITSAMIALSITLSAYLVVGILHVKLIFTLDTFLILAAMVALFPPGAVNFIDILWKRGIDKNIPKLLDVMAEAGRIGVSIPRALEIASAHDLGPLTPELKKFVAQLSWGYSFKEAVAYVIKRTNTSLARRTFSLILLAHEAGGDVKEVLEQIKGHMSNIQLTIKERKAMMRPYITIIYAAFFIFLGIDVLLLQVFFKPMLTLQDKLQETGVTFLQMGLNIDTISTIFFHMAAIQAFIGGLVAGKLGEASVTAGVKHIIILLASALGAFYLFVW
jgi:flagellar protein FlaJ